MNIPFSVRQNYNKIQVTIFPPFMKRLLLYAHTLFVCPFFVRFFYFKICVFPLNSVTLSFPSLFTFMHWKLGHLHSLYSNVFLSSSPFPLRLFIFTIFFSTRPQDFPIHAPALHLILFELHFNTIFPSFIFLSFSPQRFCSLTIFSRLTPS